MNKNFFMIVTFFFVVTLNTQQCDASFSAMNKTSGARRFYIKANKEDFGMPLFLVFLNDNNKETWGESIAKKINDSIESEYKMGLECFQFTIARDEYDENPFIIDYTNKAAFSECCIKDFFSKNNLNYGSVVMTVKKINPTCAVDNEDCPICLSNHDKPSALVEIEKGNVIDAERIITERLFLPNCGHESQFHRGCLKKALSENPICPLCRASVVAVQSK